MRISLPRDADGFLDRECTSNACSPGYFKVKPGTGLTVDPPMAFCPYCRTTAPPTDFRTKDQHRFAREVAVREGVVGVRNMIREAFNLGEGDRRMLPAGGLLTIELEMEPPKFEPIPRPLEEEMRRDVTCPKCTLEQVVFGLARWCGDCGSDIFVAHLAAEFGSVRRTLGDVDRRRETLGPRVAARDVENALEDVVSIFEGVMKFILRARLQAQAIDDAAIEKTMSGVKNAFQNLKRGDTLLQATTGLGLLDALQSDERKEMSDIFEKRHPIAHNLGVADLQYLKKTQDGVLQGRELRVIAQEVERAIALSGRVLEDVYSRACGSAG